MPRQKPEHIMERRYKRLNELFDVKLKALMEASRVGDRPMFMQELTDAEQISRWQDPTMKAIIETQILQKEGEGAVLDWNFKMQQLWDKQKEKYLKRGEM